jgi:protein ImuA
LPWQLASTVWRGNELLRRGGAVVPTGHERLDRELPGGGWPCGALTELLQPHAGVSEWRMVGPGLARVVAEGGTVLLIGPPQPPHLPGLRQYGLLPERFVWIESDSADRRLWITEEAIKANVQGAVLAWLPKARPEQLRRLQSCAQRHGGPVFLFRPAPVQAEASPAPLRLLVQPGAEGGIRLRILKRRGPQHESELELAALSPALERVLPRRVIRPAPIAPTLHHGSLVGADSQAVVAALD